MRSWPLLAIVGAAALSASPTLAQESESVALDYAAAQQRLLQRSDAIAASDAHVRGREAQAGATRSLGRPEVDFEAQLLDYQKTLYLPLGPLAPLAGSFDIPDTLRFRQRRTATRPIVTATMPLYAGGQISGTQAGARAQLDQARAERGGTIDSALLQLVQAYYGQQLAERALGVRRDVLAGLERHVADAERLEREGFISRAQRLQAQVARDDAAREYEMALADLANANVALAGLLRAPGGVRPTSPLFVISRPLEPRETYQDAALASHPELDRLRALEAQAEAGVTIEQSRLRPTLYLFGQYNLDRQDALFSDPDWTVGIGLRYRIASGLGRNQAVEAARQTVSQASAGLREARMQIEIGVTRAWNEAEAARARFLLLDSSRELAAENLRLQSLSYREQLATSLDVIDAQLGLGRARIQHAQAAYDYVLALARLLNFSGQLTRLPDYIARADKEIP